MNIHARDPLAHNKAIYYHGAAPTHLSLDVDEDLSGYILGLGGEALLTDNLSLKLEYRYAQYDGTTVSSKASDHDKWYYKYKSRERWIEEHAKVKIDDVEEHSVRAVLAFRLGHDRAAPIESLK